MPSELESLPPGTRRSVIERWIGLNILYAKARRERYRDQERPEKAKAWEVWESFHLHALQELRDGGLDDWMANLHDDSFDPTSTDRGGASRSQLPPQDVPTPERDAT